MSLFDSILKSKSSGGDIFSKSSQYGRGEPQAVAQPVAQTKTKGQTAPSTNGTEMLVDGEKPSNKLTRERKKKNPRHKLLQDLEGEEQLPKPEQKRQKIAPGGREKQSKAQKSGTKLEECSNVLIEEAGPGITDEEGQLSRTVFVGNLPPSTASKALKRLFSRCGDVASVRLRSVPLKLDKKLPRRAAILGKRISSEMGPAKAYVVFKDAASVKEALKLNMSEVEQHHIRVDRASKPTKNGKGSSNAQVYERSRSIFVGNLPFDVRDEELISLFNGDLANGSVEAVRVIRDGETNIGKGFGYVLFKDKNEARMALAKDTLKLRNRPLRITTVSKSTPKSPAAQVAPGLQGARGRLLRKEKQLGSSSAPWQGLQTKGIGKKVKSTGTVKRTTHASSGPQRLPKESAGVKKKKPSVAARKARQLGLPVSKAANKGKHRRR